MADGGEGLASPRHSPAARDIVLELLILAMVPAMMALALMFDLAQSAALMFGVVCVALALFFAGYERSKPGLRQIMPTLVMAALAAAGRILFAPVPDFKPLSAIAVIAGASLGRRNGFMAGALAALASNFFFGQGMWSPWQMYAWGLIGYLGGVLAQAGLFPQAAALQAGHRSSSHLGGRGRAQGHARFVFLLVFGFASGLLYGVILNTYGALGFVRPLTVPGVVAYFAASLPFDILHGIATAAFLAFLYIPWARRIERVTRKYALR